jgi:PKD repeat protein
MTILGTVAANHLQTAARSTAAVQIPTYAQAGDVAVFIMSQNTGVATFTAPTGWTARRSVPDVVNNNLQAQVWTKDLVTSEIGTTVTFSSSLSARLPGVLTIVRGTTAGQMSIALATPVATASTSHLNPAVTTTVDNTELLTLWALRVATAAPAPDLTTGGTQTDDNTVKTAFTTAPNYTIHVSHRTTPGAAGSYGGSTATSSAAATSLVYTLLAPPVTSVGAPVASFVASPQIGTVPLAVTFTNTSTGSPTAYLWNFGDGTTSTAQNPTHTYTSPGTYSVSLQVSNSVGSSLVVRDAVSASEPAAAGGGMQVYVLRSGVKKLLTLYVNTTGGSGDSGGGAPSAGGDWFREATWDRNALWGSHAANNGAGLADSATVTDALTKSIGVGTKPIADEGVGADALSIVRPKMATLTDTFTSLNTVKWSFGSNASIVSNQLQLTASGIYEGARSVDLYDLTDSHVDVEVVQVLSSTVNNQRNDTTLTIHATPGGSNRLVAVKEGSNLYFIAYDNNTSVSQASIAYSNATHRRWRISESGGTVTWWTSADGVSWTSRHTWFSTIDLTDCYAILEAGHWGSSGTYTPALFDNVNS